MRKEWCEGEAPGSVYSCVAVQPSVGFCFCHCIILNYLHLSLQLPVPTCALFNMPLFLCPLPIHLYFSIVSVILYRAVSSPNYPDILPHSLCLIGFWFFYCGWPICFSAFLFLHVSGVKKRGEISCLFSIIPYCLASQAIQAQTAEGKVIGLSSKGKKIKFWLVKQVKEYYRLK